MKKYIMALFAITLLTGCSTWFNGKIDNPLIGTPYQAGRTFVFLDVVTKPIQPEEMQRAIDIVYTVAVNNLINFDLTDETVKQIIAQRYPDATPEFRAVLFNLYKNMTIRLLSQVNANPNLPSSEIIEEFNRGIKDALALYNPSVLPGDGLITGPAPYSDEDLTALLNTMEGME